MFYTPQYKNEAMKNNPSKITLIIGKTETFKTTLLLQLLYNRMASTKLCENDAAVIISSKNKFESKPLLFGRYCPTNTLILKMMNIKYMETFKEIMQFLLDIQLIPLATSKKLRFVAIDCLEHYCDYKTIDPKDELRRYLHLLNLLCSKSDYLLFWGALKKVYGRWRKNFCM